MKNQYRKKPIILTFVRYYLPGSKSGGPVRSIANMVERLSDDFQFLIVTSDRDMTDDKPYNNIQVNNWNKVGNAQVFYASFDYFSLKKITALINSINYDILYLNSFFDPVFTQLPLLAKLFKMIPGKPVLLATRGEFSQGALNFKSLKKNLFISISKIVKLYSNLYWHASNNHEKEDILRIIGVCSNKVCIATDLPELLNLNNQKNKLVKSINDPLQVVFMSRISPNKNLDYSLRILNQVDIPVQYDIFGVIDDQAFWKKCLQLINDLPSNVEVRYKGHVRHEKVIEVLSTYDLFFLPTHGENYGHVIFEAFAAGLPVLISDQTPWRNLEALDIGWDLPLSNQTIFINVIRSYAKTVAADRNKKRKKVRLYATRIVDTQDILIANKRMFAKILEKQLLHHD